MERIFLFLAFSIVFSSCHEDTPTPREIQVSTAKIIPLTRVKNVLAFKDTLLGRDTFQCTVTTGDIRRNDTIKYVRAKLLGNYLRIDISTSPNLFGLDSSYFLVHDVKFNLIGLKPKIYNLQLNINSILQLPFDVNFK